MVFDISQSAAKINELQAQMKKLREEATAAGRDAFSDACKSLFAAHPNLAGFRWTQYTPYFNDGEACEFGVNDLYVRTKEIEASDPDCEAGDYEDGFIDCSDRVWNGSKFVPAEPDFAAMTKDVRAVFSLLDEESCLALFGDHVKVTVTADGVDTEEYEHD